MKKFVIVMMILVLVSAAMMSASAELNFRTYSIESRILGTRATGEVVWDSRYFVRATSEFEDGEEVILEVSQEEYEALAEAEEKASEVKESKPWYGKVASFVTFWNGND